MRLAEGMPVVDGWWLSQVILATVDRWGGLHGLQTLFAVVVLATYLLFYATFYRQTNRPLVSLLGVVLVLAVGWSRLLTIRPENSAVLCLAALAWLLVRPSPDL